MSIRVAIIGAGPAGLIAAETLLDAGCDVAIYDRMKTPGRKLLRAGVGGLNLTKDEDLAAFLPHYGAAASHLRASIEAFPPPLLRRWADVLGAATFVGTSGRLFPKGGKASPLLRAWLRRLQRAGARFHLQHRWTGWDGDRLCFSTPAADVRVEPDATLLALGGASWPQLGSDGSWIGRLAARGVDIVPFAPSNGGFEVAWSAHFSARFAGRPIKPLVASFGGRSVQGEAMVTQAGIEGGAIYALSPLLREAIARDGAAMLTLDLRPQLDLASLARRFAKPRGSRSFSTWLAGAIGLAPIEIALLREAGGAISPEAVKFLQLRLDAPFAIEGAIASAGGIAWRSIDDDFALRAIPNHFVAGEMLDWEAPTGGYLLQACFATGVAAARGLLHRAGIG